MAIEARSMGFRQSRACRLLVGMLLLTVSASVASDSRMAATKHRESNEVASMVIIGASYAQDWDIAQIAGMRVVNRGVGGEQTQKMLDRFEVDVLRAKPDAVLIWGFINDIFRSPRDDVKQSQDRVRGNIETMVARATAAGINPILATEVTITSPSGLLNRLRGWYGRALGKQSYQAYINQNVRETNQWIREYGRTMKISVMDFESVLADDSGERQRKFAIDDGSHLSKEAYAALTAYVERELRP